MEDCKWIVGNYGDRKLRETAGVYETDASVGENVSCNCELVQLDTRPLFCVIKIITCLDNHLRINFKFK